MEDSDVLVLALVGIGGYLIFRAIGENGGQILCNLPFATTLFPGTCADQNQPGGNPYPPGYTYPAETVTQAGPIGPLPTIDTGTIEGGTSLVTASGNCQYPDGTIFHGRPGQICPIDVPNHGGQSLPI